MGGADFVQWHGNYPMLSKTVELRSLAEGMRAGRGKTQNASGQAQAGAR
jgi:hypothetical protein